MLPLAIFALTLAQPETLGPGDHTRTLTMGDQKRTYLVHIPKNVDSKKPAPVVLALHGLGMTGSMMPGFCGMNKKADEAGFIVVYPSGYLVSWNSGGFKGQWAKGKPDDVAFIAKVLDDLGSVVKVDEKRVYACGMSNGAMMCYRLAAELSDRIAAIAPVAGTIAIDESQPKRPVPVIHFHGTKDPLVPFEQTKKKTQTSMFLKSVDESIKTWVKLNGCDEKPKATDVLSKDGDELKVTRTTYGGGKNGAEVVLVAIEGGGHTWPGQKPPVAFIGKSAMNISANDLIWEFFQKHPMPPSEAEVKEKVQQLDPKKNDKASRLEAIQWFDEHSAVESAGLAMPALERSAREDPDKEVRSRAIMTFGLIAYNQKVPCPRVIVEALLDTDEYMILSAATVAYLFKSFAPGSVDILLRAAESANVEVRSAAPSLLFQAGGKDKRVLQALDKATRDPDFGVRLNAHAAKFRADDDLASFLGFMLRVRRDPDGVLGPLDKNSEYGKRILAIKNITSVSYALMLARWSDERPDDFAAALMKYLDDPSPAMRSGSAEVMGAAVIWIDPVRINQYDPAKFIGKYLDPKYQSPPVSDALPKKSKVGVRLYQLKARQRLQELADNDADLDVRIFARYALTRFAMVDEKKKD